MRPILTINQQEGEKKVRKIDLFRDDIFKDIDIASYKFAQASAESPKDHDVISSDSNEPLDRVTLNRMIAYRDTELRDNILFALAPQMDSYANDKLDDKSVLRFMLRVNADFDDNRLQLLADYMHRYIVYGVLYDWYAQIATRQANTYGAQLRETMDRIVSLLRGSSVAKRPMQPFGPANKIYY